MYYTLFYFVQNFIIFCELKKLKNKRISQLVLIQFSKGAWDAYFFPLQIPNQKSDWVNFSKSMKQCRQLTTRGSSPMGHLNSFCHQDFFRPTIMWSNQLSLSQLLISGPNVSNYFLIIFARKYIYIYWKFINFLCVYICFLCRLWIHNYVIKRNEHS